MCEHLCKEKKKKILSWSLQKEAVPLHLNFWTFLKKFVLFGHTLQRVGS